MFIALSGWEAFAVGLTDHDSGGIVLCLSYRRRHVLCHQARRATRACRHLGLGSGLVQLSRPDGGSGERGIHGVADDSGLRQYELVFDRWSLCLFSVCRHFWERRPANKHRTALQTVLLSIAILVVSGVVCSLSTRWLHRIILWFAPINSEWALPSTRHLTDHSVVASVAICIALLVLTPNKQSAAMVFGDFTDGSGWGSKGFSFLLG